MSMIKITGYKQVEYPHLLEVLEDYQNQVGKSDIQIAADINVKTANTVKNAFCIEGQMVSDNVLTNIMKSVELDGFVMTYNGEKYYYVSNKK